ncbi:unnamed protein product, partial [Trichobilharzia szidati]
INSLVVRNQAFAEVTNVFSDDFFANEFDGIIGMSRRNVSIYGNTPFFPNILSQSKDMDPVFSFYLSRKNGLAGGEMVLGGVDPEYFTGDFENLPVLSANRWIVNIKSLKVNGVEYCDAACSGIIDTGTSLIVGSNAVVGKINSQLGAVSATDGEYKVDCGNLNNLPPIEFIFKERRYVYQAKDYVVKDSNWLSTDCLSPFRGSGKLSKGFWILGDVFMRKFYTVFDFGEREIRLADVDDG